MSKLTISNSVGTCDLRSRWHTMDSAPKDGTKILLWEVCIGAYIGYWDLDKHLPSWEPQWLECHGSCSCMVDYTPVPKYWHELPDDESCKLMWFNKN